MAATKKTTTSRKKVSELPKTNRQKFNEFVRQEVERQLWYYEQMSDKELVEALGKFPESHVQAKLFYLLRWFKCGSNDAEVGSKADVIEWLGERTN